MREGFIVKGVVLVKLEGERIYSEGISEENDKEVGRVGEG